MTVAIDPVALASALIASPSVTPAKGPVFDTLEAAQEEPWVIERYETQAAE